MSLILSLRNACTAPSHCTATAQILLGHIHPYGLLTLHNGYEDNGSFVLQRNNDEASWEATVLGLKLFFVTGLVIFATAVARLLCPDLLG